MWIEQKQKNKYISASLKLETERRTGNNYFTGTAFRAGPAYFHLWYYGKSIFISAQEHQE